MSEYFASTATSDGADAEIVHTETESASFLDSVLPTSQPRQEDGPDVAVEFEGEQEVVTGPVETPCSFLTGAAGVGKSFLILSRIKEDPRYAVLSSTTGISAINLNATTIHSLLGFFDTDSLRDAYLSGAAQRKLRRILSDGFKNVVIDEISMCSHNTLDLLVRTFDDVNSNLAHGEHPIGLVVTGDACQLPAIPEGKKTGRARLPTPWFFDANCWPRFERNMTKLTKVWRQTDQQFLAALNYARSGNGPAAADLLAASGLRYETAVDMEFDGTTLMGKNDEVDRFNQIALDKVKGRLIGLPARRWGKQRGEWKNVPDRTIIREGAYVMLLANKYDGQDFLYANGDCGHVKGILPSVGNLIPPTIVIELVRNGREVGVEPIVRAVESRDKPDDMGDYATIPKKDDVGGYVAKPHYRGDAKRFVSGQLNYYPIRLAYASTIHRCQGLSLDRVQIDFRGWMLGGAAMGYTAMSRARTLQGLRLVGMKEVVAAKCKIDPRVIPWL